jgi:large subunit ribosomal protein L25
VGDVKTEEYTFLHPDNTSIVQVKASRNAVADEEDEEEGAEGAEGAEAAATPAAE